MHSPGSWMVRAAIVAAAAPIPGMAFDVTGA